jgi:hypothetical protein
MSRNVQLSPAVRMGHVKALEMTSCKYPIRRIEVKVDTVPSGNMNYIQDNMFVGQLPKRLIWYFLRLDTSFPYWYIVPYNCEYNLRFQSWGVTVWRESVVRPCSVPQN